MKKIITIVILLLSSGAFAQRNVAKKVTELIAQNTTFKKYAVLNENNSIQNNATRNAVTKATYGKINLQAVAAIFANKEQYIEVAIPYQGNTIDIQLYQVNLFAEGFHIDTDKAKSIAYNKGVYYRGIVKGDSNSLVSFNFFKEEFNAVISSATLNNLVVAKLDSTSETLDYIIYSDKDLKGKYNFECNVQSGTKNSPENTENVSSPETVKCVTIYFEIDYNLYQANSYSTTSTANWMTSVFNNVQSIYTNDGITTSLKSLFIWTSPDSYMDLVGTSLDYLEDFQNTRVGFDGDIAYLVGIDSGGLGGIAYRDIICGGYNYAYSDVYFEYSTVPTYSWTVNVIAHELGHSLGSQHTHDCVWNGNNTAIDGCGPQAGYPGDGTCVQGPIPNGGTIMSYCHLLSESGVNFANGFGPQPAEFMLNNVNSKSCLSTDCINTCINSVTEIIVTNITTDSALITWNDVGTNSSWKISVNSVDFPNFVWNTVQTNSYTISGLTPNSYYFIRILPSCENVATYNFREKIFATNASDFCNNVVFTDTGGISGDYGFKESWTRTMTPNNIGLKLRVTFSSFSLEQDSDYLYIYNGPDETFNDLTFGGLSGSSIPNQFDSTAIDGSLTFKFISSNYENSSGWNATISCTGTAGIEENDFVNFSYYPNPSNGKVNMSCNSKITDVMVYNLEGRLLFKQNKNDFFTTIDISQFAIGTYFFKVKMGDVAKNFKVLKL